jgi:oligopeptide/dipeptide ABC transporter ATP-binding protein
MTRIAKQPGHRGDPAEALLWLTGLRKTYSASRRFGSRVEGGVVKALDGVSFDVRPGEVFGVVGESGSGKTTLARCILRLTRPDEGEILFDSVDIAGKLSKDDLRQLRRRLQCAFQDPYASLDPRFTVAALVEEPLLIHGVKSADERTRRMREMLELVGINPAAADRKPHAFSGGQRQRIALARALVLNPDLVVLDEPVSALDVSIQAQILNLLARLQEELRLTYILVVHDLLVAEHFCDRIAVVYAGRVMELAEKNVLFSRPAHPYTISLLAAAPIADPQVARSQLRASSQLDTGAEAKPSEGCPFRPRCPVGRDRDICASETPPLIATEPDHWAACHFPNELDPKKALWSNGRQSDTQTNVPVEAVGGESS